jgi:hypothetical protein
MGCMGTSGVDELVLRFDRVATRIEGADYSGAMKALRYWDAGYDLGTVPRKVLDQLHDHSRAARVCLTCGDTGGASDHVRHALELATASRQPGEEPPVRRARRRQPSNSPS